MMKSDDNPGANAGLARVNIDPELHRLVKQRAHLLSARGKECTIRSFTESALRDKLNIPSDYCESAA